jgi:ketosteroid isomerase-like protein
VGIPEGELIERLRRGYDAFNRRDYDAVMEIVDPDIVLVRGGPPELRGAEAQRAFRAP